DLEAAFDAIKAARLHDTPGDRCTRDECIFESNAWFFVPEYDRHWFSALRFWSRARTSQLASTKTEYYAKTADAYAQYLAAAPANDRWIDLAKRRVAALEKERTRALKAARAHVAKPEAKGEARLRVPKP